jgi:hypothetical protein
MHFFEGESLFRFLGWLVGVVGLVVAVNAAFMLVSPRAWFRLPGWVPGRGALTAKRYSTGIGALEVRVLGLLFLSVLAWLLYDTLK